MTPRARLSSGSVAGKARFVFAPGHIRTLITWILLRRPGVWLLACGSSGVFCAPCCQTSRFSDEAAPAPPHWPRSPTTACPARSPLPAARSIAAQPIWPPTKTTGTRSRRLSRWTGRSSISTTAALSRAPCRPRSVQALPGPLQNMLRSIPRLGRSWSRTSDLVRRGNWRRSSASIRRTKWRITRNASEALQIAQNWAST